MKHLEEYSTSTLRDELRRREGDMNEAEPQKDPHPGPQMTGKTMWTCHRETAVGVLKGKARRLRCQADGIDALVACLPADLCKVSPEAEEALWSLFQDVCR
jgi:hypothetical protein